MAIIYSYPRTLNILDSDILLGTTTVLVAGKPKNQTKSFKMSDISDYVSNNYAVPALQQVVETGNTIVMPTTVAKGIDITMANLSTVYQIGTMITIPAQTGEPFPPYNPAPDAFLARINGQEPGTLVGFVGGFVSEATGADNVGFFAGSNTGAQDSIGFFSRSTDAHTGPHFLATKIISGNSTDVFRVENNGTITGTQYKVSALNTAPLSATATGATGEIRITSAYIYVCIATNTWVRTALTTWT